MDTKNIDPLESAATPSQLYGLARHGALAAATLAKALKLIGHIPSAVQWKRFLDMMLLILGAGLVISGVFFFFAFNWDAMPRLVKLGILELAIVCAVALSHWQKLDSLAGKIALSAASALVGALLGVYGQIYQQGANAYQYFLLWALLITGWVFISNFWPLWLIWIVLLNLSVGFYGEQALGNNGLVYLYLFLLNGAAMLLWELAHQRGMAWLRSRWPLRFLALPSFAALLIPTLMFIFDPSSTHDGTPWYMVMAVLFVLCSILVLYIYSQKIIDLFVLVICSFSVIIAVNAGILKLVDFDTLTLFGIAIAFVIQAGLVVTWLQRLATSIK